MKALHDKKEPEHESKVYEGFRAIKSAFYEMYAYIGKNSEYCVFPIGEQLGTDELRIFWSQVLAKQQNMKIKIRSLPHKSWKRIFQEHYKDYRGLKVKYTTQRFPTGIFIFKDHILNVVWSEEPVAFLIKSRGNYRRWQEFFDEQWKKSS